MDLHDDPRADPILAQYAREVASVNDSRPADPHPAALYAITDDAHGVQVRLLRRGNPHRLLHRAVPPADARAIALVSGGWAAPMNPDGTATTRPSQHPDRRRCRTVAVIGAEGTIVSLLSVGNDRPVVLTNGSGTIPTMLRRVWARRIADATA